MGEWHIHVFGVMNNVGCSVVNGWEWGKTGGREPSDVAGASESGLWTSNDCEVGSFPASNWKCAEGQE